MQTTTTLSPTAPGNSVAYSYFLVFDLVDAERMPSDVRIAQRERLQEIVFQTGKIQASIERDDALCLPFEGGIVLIFWDDFFAAFEAARLLAISIRSIQTLQACLALHSGRIDRNAEDPLETPPVAMAQQICALGDKDHLLISNGVAAWIPTAFRACLQPTKKFPLNDPKAEMLYNYVAETAGNPRIPGKLQGNSVEVENVSFLYMDIVGSSRLPMEKQIKMYKELNHIVSNVPTYKLALEMEELISRPTGDGMALVFLGEMTQPLQCAIEITRALQRHSSIKLRIGIHFGPVEHVTDINGSPDISGDGIVTTRRVMDFGDAGHILLSKEMATRLMNIPVWQQCFQSIGNCVAKHKQIIHIYNFYTKEEGNPRRPPVFLAAVVEKKPLDLMESAPRVANVPQTSRTSRTVRNDRSEGDFDFGRAFRIACVVCVLGGGGVVALNQKDWKGLFSPATLIIRLRNHLAARNKSDQKRKPSSEGDSLQLANSASGSGGNKKTSKSGVAAQAGGISVTSASYEDNHDVQAPYHCLIHLKVSGEPLKTEDVVLKLVTSRGEEEILLPTNETTLDAGEELTVDYTFNGEKPKLKLLVRGTQVAARALIWNASKSAPTPSDTEAAKSGTENDQKGDAANPDAEDQSANSDTGDPSKSVSDTDTKSASPGTAANSKTNETSNFDD